MEGKSNPISKLESYMIRIRNVPLGGLLHDVPPRLSGITKYLYIHADTHAVIRPEGAALVTDSHNGERRIQFIPLISIIADAEPSREGGEQQDCSCDERNRLIRSLAREYSSRRRFPHVK